MKRILIAAIIAVCVWLTVSYPHLMINPGKLVAGHQDLKDKCNSCHEPFWGISSEKCMDCHKLSEIGMNTAATDEAGNKEPILFHDQLAGQKCTACHSDHKGIEPSVSLSTFSHHFLSVSKRDQCNSCHSKPADDLHSQLTASCVKCHNTNDWKLTSPFNHDLLQQAEKANCVSCHQSPDDPYHRFVKDNCSACHTTREWVPSTFDHSAYFSLDRDHNVTCSTCHTGNNYSAYTCYGCHEHSENSIREEHLEEGIKDFTDCASCHRGSEENGDEGRGERRNNIEREERERGGDDD